MPLDNDPRTLHRQAALMQSLPDPLRGRAFGMFLTVNGVIASLAHWAMGAVADSLEQRALTPASFGPWFAFLGALIALGMLGVPAIRWLRRYCAGQKVRLSATATG